ncbi:MAG: nickel-binding protein [Dehalococcoidia bacterium]
MPLYTILRQVDASLSDAELDALVGRMIGGAIQFEGVRWQRSYTWDGGEAVHSMCVYEGPSLEAVRRHSELCAVPFSEIREVIEYLPTLHPEAAHGRASADANFYLVTRRLPLDTAPGEPDAPLFRSATGLASPGISWIRSFWDDEWRRFRSIYVASHASLIETHARLSGIRCDEILRVDEQLPSDWVAWYDAMGAPRHWEEQPASAEA